MVVKADLARGGEEGMIGDAVRCDRIQTRTQDAKILKDKAGGHAGRRIFNHYIGDARGKGNLGAEQ